MKDSKTTVDEMKEKVRKFCEARDWDQFHGAKDLSVGVITEAAELLEHFRFKSEKEVREMFEKPKKKEHISEEMADVLFLLVRMGQMYDVDLSNALERKMQKNEENYPVDKAKGSNKKYNEFENSE